MESGGVVWKRRDLFESLRWSAFLCCEELETKLPISRATKDLVVCCLMNSVFDCLNVEQTKIFEGATTNISEEIPVYANQFWSRCSKNRTTQMIGLHFHRLSISGIV